jgi:hypothetical protein
MNLNSHLSRYKKSPLIGKKASKKTLKRYCDEISRSIALYRDGNKCFYCGGTSYLQVHHLISRKNLKTRFNLNNLLTLCAGCHNFRITAIHHSPWIIFEELRQQRFEQYKWFCLNRQKEKLLASEPINYLTILEELMKVYYEYFPLQYKKMGCFPLEQEKQIAWEYNSGFSTRYLANKFKTTTPTIRNILNRQNVTMRQEGTPSDIERQANKQKMQLEIVFI